MKKVYQTIISGTNGDCMRAAVASLLEIPLESVPDFKSFGLEWNSKFFEFINHSEDFEYEGCINNPKDLGAWGDSRMEKIKDEIGVDGLFLATVYSTKYFNAEDYCNNKRVVTHSVLIDWDYNIVHDPNPEYDPKLTDRPMSEQLGCNGVICVFLINRKTK
jgi:hypothetical protein